MNLTWKGWVLVVLVVFVLMGCGETVRGVGKDSLRVARGIKTIFVSGN